MTEDMTNRFSPIDPPWRLSGHDAARIAELRMVILEWLAAFSAAADIRAFAETLNDLETLEQSGTPPRYAELEVSKIDPERGGLSAHIGIGESSISLTLIEFVPGVNGVLDHGTVVDGDGRPLSLHLDPMGSFDTDRFESWWSYAMDLTPSSNRDPTFKASIKREEV